MLQWLKELDRLLRGEATSPSALRQGMVPVPALGLAVLIVILGMLYGLCMGCYALINRKDPEPLQLLATMLKVPALFLLTLLVTFPSLYVFNALVGSRLSLLSLLRLMIATVAVMMTVLASFGPIVAFFSVTTPNYPFIGLLKVLLFSVSGLLGLVFLLQTLHRLSIAGAEPVEVVPADSDTSSPPSPPSPPKDPPQAAAKKRASTTSVTGYVQQFAQAMPFSGLEVHSNKPGQLRWQWKIRIAAWEQRFHGDLGCSMGTTSGKKNVASGCAKVRAGQPDCP